jgi:HD-like signal output (HDOD) protein/ActR/RegA family two-component response regulator
VRKKILFVDDDSNVLDGIRRMLRDKAKEWDLHFRQSGADALALAATELIDVIVADLRMPGMDGAHLLREIMLKHPRTVRIILSGQSDQDAIFSTVGTSHQFLSKPCDASALRTTIGRALALRDLLGDEKLKIVLGALGTLPSLPALYAEVVDELRSPEASILRVGDIIARDVGMTARVLQLVNSAYFCLPQRITNPAHAAALLGIETIKTLVLTVGVFTQFKEAKGSGLSIEAALADCFEVAALAADIARSEGVAKEVVEASFRGGMLRDVGNLVLACKCPEQYAAALAHARKQQVSQIEAERRLFSTSHAEVGGYLLGLWGLPNPIVEAVAFHHSPAFCPTGGFAPVIAVHVADALVSRRRALPGGVAANDVNESHLETIGLGGRLAAWRELDRKQQHEIAR